MLRVHFTADDLMRTRFAAEPAPLVELTLGIATLRRNDPLFARWCREAGAALPRAAAPLREIVPASGASPLFLDPVSAELGEGMELVMSAPGPLVRAGLRRITGHEAVRITPWLRGLKAGDREAWHDLRRALSAAHSALLEGPAWQRIRAGFRAEVTWRGRLMAEQGLQQALVGLFPGSRWRGATLEIDVAVDREFRAAGRGVTLMPAMMGMTRPLIGNHPDGSILLVYPAMIPFPLIGEPDGGDPLGALLGTTRAAVLRALIHPRSTTGLAAQLGVSAASASEHARTLRAAGLIATRRNGKAVWHSCTPLGARLLAERGGPSQLAPGSPNAPALSPRRGSGTDPRAGP
jgi:DNA-binding transcriptional ArsR family regulator